MQRIDGERNITVPGEISGEVALRIDDASGSGRIQCGNDLVVSRHQHIAGQQGIGHAGVYPGRVYRTSRIAQAQVRYHGAALLGEAQLIYNAD